jgi:L-arabinose transport system substrate-binding protein
VKHWLVCGTNDNAVLGAIRALEGRGFAPESSVGIGINGTDCIVELRSRSRLHSTARCCCPPKSTATKRSEMLYKWIKDGVEPALDTRTTGTLITRENFRQS